MRPYIFFAVLFVLITYVGFKIAPFLRYRLWVVIPVTIFLAISAWGWFFIYRGDDKILNSAWYPPVMWLGSAMMGFLGSFLIFSLIIDAVHIFSLITNKLFINSQGSEVDSLRRKFVFQTASSVALVGAAIGTAIGYQTARYGLKTKKVEVAIKNLPDDLKDLKIVQISDIHVGLTIDEAHIRRMVDKVMALKPDLIAITGDLADGSPAALGSRWHPLRDLKARLGVYFITGNHEYYSGVEDWLQTTSELGFVNLINENRLIQEKNSRILIAGVTDSAGGSFLESHVPNVQMARGTDQSAHVKILLAHRPEAFTDAEPAGFDIQLSGHTHAGQFFPFNLVVMFAHKFYKGLNRHGKMWVYVNQGTGYWGPANRFALPPEITLLQMTKEI